MKQRNQDGTRMTLPDTALARVLELATLLNDINDRGLADAGGLTRARAAVIWRLRDSGPVTQSDLSRAMQVTPRNITGIVDALEANDFVARERHPTDRRAFVVSLTERGEHMAEQMTKGYRELATAVFGDLADAELREFVTTLTGVLQRFREADVQQIGSSGNPDGDHPA
ncbi:MarR family winged helix-turn-helix transcriptional regulator [Kibdelosporangium aridum]|uniref:MarR family winged helix-turn-helix transcriptional regulator n=1 Tax=Kibdelosporangium aridum TaxID=2030 RepID=UPI0006913DB5|nr:MarR family transcriptional regulator [Kibdelosporangium aridum]